MIMAIIGYLLFALLAGFLSWQTWVSVGIVSLSAWLIHRRTDANVDMPAPTRSGWELVLFLAAPLATLLIPAGVLAVLRFFGFEGSTAAFGSIELTMLVLQFAATLAMLWRHRKRVFRAWFPLAFALLLSIGFYILREAFATSGTVL